MSVLTLSSTVAITTAATTIIQQQGDLAQTNDDNFQDISKSYLWNTNSAPF